MPIEHPSKAVAAWLEQLGVRLGEEQISQADRYVSCVMAKKEMLNVTAAETADELWRRHMADAFAAVPLLVRLCSGNPSPVITDAGAGGGFIGAGIKIAMPQAKVFLAESVSRKCAFMNWALAETGLKGINVRPGRIGEKQDANSDIVIERAMGQIEDIMPLCSGLLSEKGGYFIAYQSSWENPAPAVSAAAGRAGLKFSEAVKYTLPCDRKERFLAVFKKESR